MIQLIRKGQKRPRNVNVLFVEHPASKTVFDFWLNVRSAAYFAASDLSNGKIGYLDGMPSIVDVMSFGDMCGTSSIPFNRKRLRIQ